MYALFAPLRTDGDRQTDRQTQLSSSMRGGTVSGPSSIHHPQHAAESSRFALKVRGIMTTQCRIIRVRLTTGIVLKY